MNTGDNSAAASAAAAHTEEPKGDSVATCTVACNLPSGIVLEFKGAVPAKFKAFVGRPAVMIKGRNSTITRQGYGLTSGVDAEFMTAWLALNADMEIVRNGFIFMEKTVASATDRSIEQADLRTGLEPMEREVKDSKGKTILEPADKAA